MTRKLQPSSAGAILVFIRCCSPSNEAQKTLLMEDRKLSSAEHWFTHVEPRHCLSLQLPDPFFFSFRQRYQCHNYSSDVMNFILACRRRQARQIPACLSKQSGCQALRLEEFPQRALPAPLMTHNDSDISGNHSLFLGFMIITRISSSRLVLMKNYPRCSRQSQQVTESEI